MRGEGITKAFLEYTSNAIPLGGGNQFTKWLNKLRRIGTTLVYMYNIMHNDGLHTVYKYPTCMVYMSWNTK